MVFGRNLSVLEKALLTVALAGQLLHLFWVAQPVAGWRSWKQADTAAITRNFHNEEFSPLHPRIDWGGWGPGYVEAEAQIYTTFVALIYKLTGVQEWVGRLLSSVFSALTALYLYLYGKRLRNQLYGLSAAAVFSAMPMEIYFGAAFMPEPLMLLALIGALFHFHCWLEKNSRFDWAVSLIFFLVAVLIKPQSLCLGLPLLFLSHSFLGWKFLRRWDIWLYAVLVFVIPAAYYLHAHGLFIQYGNSFGIWNDSADKWFNLDLLMTSKFYQRLIFTNIAKRLLTYGGFAVFILGLFLKFEGREKVVIYWLGGLVVYMLVVARGNYLLDYYQLPLLLPASFVIAGTIEWVASNSPVHKTARDAVILAILMIAPLSAARNVGFTNHVARDVSLVNFAQNLDAALPQECRVVTLTKGNPTFLYHINRKGWVKWPGKKALKNNGDLPTDVYIAGKRSDVKSLCTNHKLLIQPVLNDDHEYICVKYTPL